jgi:hypothetical protein
MWRVAVGDAGCAGGPGTVSRAPTRAAGSPSPPTPRDCGWGAGSTARREWRRRGRLCHGLSYTAFGVVGAAGLARAGGDPSGRVRWRRRGADRRPASAPPPAWEVVLCSCPGAPAGAGRATEGARRASEGGRVGGRRCGRGGRPRRLGRRGDFDAVSDGFVTVSGAVRRAGGGVGGGRAAGSGPGGGGATGRGAVGHKSRVNASSRPLSRSQPHIYGWKRWKRWKPKQVRSVLGSARPTRPRSVL